MVMLGVIFLMVAVPCNTSSTLNCFIFLSFNKSSKVAPPWAAPFMFVILSPSVVIVTVNSININPLETLNPALNVEALYTS